MNQNRADKDATEFFVKAMYYWFLDFELLAEDFFYVAAMTVNVNNMYKREILDQMN